MNIDEQLKKELLEVFSNDEGLVDHGLPVGYYNNWREDSLGRGPQSNPNFHFHSAVYFFPEKIWEIIGKYNIQDKDSLFSEIIDKINQILAGGVDFFNKIVNQNSSIQEKIPEIMMKQIDPYSTIVFGRGGRSFLLSAIKGVIRENGISALEVASFFHHTNKNRLGDSRFSERGKN